MIEKNDVKIGIEKLEEIIRNAYDLDESNLKISYSSPNYYNEHILKITSKSYIQDLENIRVIELSEKDVISILNNYLSDSGFSCKSFSPAYEPDHNFSGFYVSLIKNAKKTL